MALKSPLAIVAALTASLAVSLAAQEASAASCIGSCGSLGANGDVIAPPSGATYGWISTAGGVDGAGQIAGLPAGSTDGSSFMTSAFSATAGQTLQYYFNFISSDGQFQPDQFVYEDYASVQLVDATTGNLVAMLFNARAEPTGLIVPGQGLPAIDPGVQLKPPSSGMAAGAGTLGNQPGGPVWDPLGTGPDGFSGWCWGPGCGLSGWIQTDYTVSTDGNYKLVFGVSNWGDTVYDTGLAFSGIKIGDIEIEDSVPEPATWAMMLVGMFGLGAALRRRQRRAALAA